MLYKIKMYGIRVRHAARSQNLQSNLEPWEYETGILTSRDSVRYGRAGRYEYVWASSREVDVYVPHASVRKL
jgi:hypothetical protein